jgi:hypothetical protein
MEGHDMFFPLEDIEKELDGDKQDELIHGVLAKCDQNDPPFLSAILAHANENGAFRVMEILSTDQYPFQWKIKVLRDEWGAVPGTEEWENSHGKRMVVEREIPIGRVKRNGDLVTPRVMSLAKKDGSYDRKYVQRKQFKIDDKCCISCRFDDAVYFLNNWGYNQKTNSAVTKKPEYSYEPVDIKDPQAGMKKHVRYWRFAEKDREDYAKLPNMQAKK